MSQRTDPAQVDLETKVAFLERTVDALSETLHEQAQTIDALALRLSRVEGRMTQKSASGEIEPHDSPPPHY